MKAKDNRLFITAEQCAGSISKDTPEAVIYGYAKLLSMDEAQIRVLVSDDQMDELEAAIKWFEENKLDMNLIKSGLIILMGLIPKEEVEKRNKKFKDFLESDSGTRSSIEILSMAMKTAFVPFGNLFTDGKQLNDIFNYQSDLKEKYSTEKLSDEEEPVEEPLHGIAGESETEQDIDKDSKQQEESKQNEEAETGSEPEPDDLKEPETEHKPRDLYELSDKYRKMLVAALDVVKGQDRAVVKFIKGFNQGELMKEAGREQPRAFFFFFGPPGVGKTLLAKTVAKIIGRKEKFIPVSDITSGEKFAELLGAPKKYSDAGEGTLLKFVRTNPECILIFDEIEKAPRILIKQFLQILDEGKLHNAYRDDDTDFSKAIIIFTSNAGKELYDDRDTDLTSLPASVLADAIQRETDPLGEPIFPPEMISRIASGNTILFNHLQIKQVAEIARESLDNVTYELSKEFGISVKYAKELPLLFLYTRGNDIDARVCSRQAEKFITDELFELITQLRSKDKGAKNIREINIDIERKGLDKDIDALFNDPNHQDVLLFTDKAGFSDCIGGRKYVVHAAAKREEAVELIEKHDLAAIFIDPFCGRTGEDNVLSVTDYDTEGVRLFHEIIQKKSGFPVFLIETEKELSEADRDSFMQEGAAGFIRAELKHPESFKRRFGQVMRELYMENASRRFWQQGRVLDFYTSQSASEDGRVMNITYYDLRKRQAVDVESRGTMLLEAERPKTKFEDVIGAENAKQELQYFLGYLKNPRQFLVSGGIAPKGVLLYGPPGTGKTMLARAMAGESDVNFFQTSATQFMNSYWGKSEENIRKLFAKAKKYAPSVIFIDEIDAIGRKRTDDSNSQHTARMLEELFVAMDGFVMADPKRPVFVLAATNFGIKGKDDGISGLDEGLIRRFDNRIFVDLPNEDERALYVRRTLKARGVGSVSEETITNISKRTIGQSIAVLQSILESAFRKARTAGKELTGDDINTALEEFLYGEKKEIPEKYYWETAVHEVGHAYVSYLNGDKPSYISIESRGGHLGYMMPSERENIPSYTREELIGLIRTSLAGRASETVFLAEERSVNTGASSDLANATERAWQLVCRFGMEKDQLIVLDKNAILSSPLAPEYVAKVNDILRTEMKNTIAVIENGREKIEKISKVLIRKNRLNGEEFEELMKSE